MQHQLAVRAEAGPAMDRRALRSREALRGALLRLLEQGPLDQFTTRDIARAAGVGHATFYRHYAGREALLEDLAADEINRLVDLCLPVMDTVDAAAACTALCRNIDEHRTLWVGLLTGGAAGSVKEELLRISREVAPARARFDQGLPPDLGVVLVVVSIVELLVWWLRQADPLPVAEVARILDRHILSPALGMGNPPAQS